MNVPIGSGLSLALVSLAAIACDAGEPEPATPGPRPNLVSVLGTSQVDKTTVSLLDAVEVSTSTSIRIQFDRYLDPAAAARQAVCLRSDLGVVTKLEECTDNLFLRPTYDPVTRTVTYYQQDDMARLAPDTVYKLTVFQPADDGFGFSAFDGASLSARGELLFRTSATDAKTSELPKEETVESQNARFCGTVQGIFRNRCASCHSGASAPMGLDLSSGPRVATSAVGHVAKQTQMGGDAATPLVRPVRFGVAMPIVAPGNPGESYLLYKLLADTGREPLPEEPSMAPGETGRLRDTAIVGLPMPPGSFFILPEEVAAISAWIARGAITFDCDQPLPPEM